MNLLCASGMTVVDSGATFWDLSGFSPHCLVIHWVHFSRRISCFRTRSPGDPSLASPPWWRYQVTGLCSLSLLSFTRCKDELVSQGGENQMKVRSSGRCPSFSVIFRVSASGSISVKSATTCVCAVLALGPDPS